MRRPALSAIDQDHCSLVIADRSLIILIFSVPSLPTRGQASTGVGKLRRSTEPRVRRDGAPNIRQQPLQRPLLQRGVRLHQYQRGCCGKGG